MPADQGLKARSNRLALPRRGQQTRSISYVPAWKRVLAHCVLWGALALIVLLFLGAVVGLAAGDHPNRAMGSLLLLLLANCIFGVLISATFSRTRRETRLQPIGAMSCGKGIYRFETGQSADRNYRISVNVLLLLIFALPLALAYAPEIGPLASALVPCWAVLVIVLGVVVLLLRATARQARLAFELAPGPPLTGERLSLYWSCTQPGNPPSYVRVALTGWYGTKRSGPVGILPMLTLLERSNPATDGAVCCEVPLAVPPSMESRALCIFWKLDVVLLFERGMAGSRSYEIEVLPAKASPQPSPCRT